MGEGGGERGEGYGNVWFQAAFKRIQTKQMQQKTMDNHATLFLAHPSRNTQCISDS